MDDIAAFERELVRPVSQMRQSVERALAGVAVA